MNFINRKSATVWVGVNKNDKISIHTVEPIRDEAKGIWVSGRPYINAVLYDNISKMIEKTNMSWQSSPEPFEIQFQK